MDVKKGSAQVEVVGPFGAVYLYAHNGSSIIGNLHRALNKRLRWDDPDYLSRMIFCEMVPKDEWYGELNFGIGTQMYADVDLLITVDTVSQKITIQSKSTSLHDKYILSFDDFINNFTSSARL